jgi:murein L,D-transpeptidase YcbB/YkuD
MRRNVHSIIAGLALATAVLAAPAAAQTSAEAIRARLESGTHPDLTRADLSDVRADLAAVYEATAHAPLWVRDGQPTDAARAVATEMRVAHERGLRAADYDAALLGEWIERLAGGDADAGAVARFDTAMTATLLRFLRHLSVGRIDPRRVGFGLEAAPVAVDWPATVQRVATAADPRAEIAALDPPFPLFARLREALTAYRTLERQDLPDLPDAPTLHPDETSPLTAPLRARLLALGDLPADPPAPADPALYDAPLVDAVKRFQARHGLATDGVVGRTTLEALRTPIAARREQIELAMERLRWLPRRTDDRFLIVNIPEFTLSAFEQGRSGPVLRSEVVVGSAARHHFTPILNAEMQAVVFRPYWHVPPGISRTEVLPKVRADPAYLTRNDMELIDGRIRQRPGPDNALGLIKFVLPNRHHIYLHDTPSKDLFGRPRRDFSHGCIRVARPVELAEFVLRGQGNWDAERITRAMRTGPNNRHVRLEKPVPVYLLYSTVIVSRDGEVRFFPDIYGHDATLRRALTGGRRDGQ